MEIFLNGIIEHVNLIVTILGLLKMEVVCSRYGFYKIQEFFSKLEKFDRWVRVRR